MRQLLKDQRHPQNFEIDQYIHDQHRDVLKQQLRHLLLLLK